MRYALLAIVMVANATVAHAGIRENCERDWPDNYVMQKHCIDWQGQAAERVRGPMKKAQEGIAPYVTIVTECGKQWQDGDTFNYPMVDHCIKRQIEAYNQLNPPSKEAK